MTYEYVQIPASELSLQYLQFLLKDGNLFFRDVSCNTIEDIIKIDEPPTNFVSDRYSEICVVWTKNRAYGIHTNRVDSWLWKRVYSV